MAVGDEHLKTLMRHKVLLLAPIVICFLLGSWLAFTVPREYVTGAAIFADTRVPQESTVGTTGGQSPPSAGQATLLTQLLATRAFVRAVVAASPLESDYRRLDPVSAERFLWRVAGSVSISTPGPQLVSVAVRRDDPDESLGIAKALVTEFDRAQKEQAKLRAEQQVDFTRQQAENARRALRESRSAATQAVYADATSAYSNSKLALAAVESQALQVVDQPEIAMPQPRRKTLLLGGAAGLFAGLTLSVVVFLLLVLWERRPRRLEADAEDAPVDALDLVEYPLPEAEHPMRV